MPTIETRGLIKNYGKHTALRGVDLAIEKGEVFGFIGPNGAGKTTTIRVLLGILRATAGEAAIFGLDAWRESVEIHKRIAYVPGDVNLWPNLTGGEVIDLFVRLGGEYDRAARDALIEKFELDPSKKCRALSKGNRQKVALVAALAKDAELLILDEPTSGLDPLMEQVFKDCILEKKREGKTVFLSSHILSEVEALCDRVGIIRDGQVIEIGTLGALRHLKRLAAEVETEKPAGNLSDQPGVFALTTAENRVRFSVDANHLKDVIAYLAPFGVTKFSSAEPTLEDLFMRHYDRAGGGS